MENLPTVLQDLIVEFLTFLPKLVVAIVILILALYLATVVKRLIRKALDARGASTQVTQLLSQLARWGILSLGIVTALQQVNFDITGLVAGLGIVGFALGFALQDIAANFVSGIILLVQQPFHPGDLIETGGFTGHVKAVDLRATQIMTLDGEDVLIPNGTVLSSSIVNYTKSPPKRVSVEVGVAYDSDLDKARRVAMEAVKKVNGRLEDKEPFIRFHTFGGSSIDMTVYYWVDMTRIHPMDAKDQGITLIKTAFEQSAIEIPFPIQTLYMHNQKEES